MQLGCGMEARRRASSADVDKAVKITKLHPGTHLGDRFGGGGIEVRPVDFFEVP
jgi:hypothetical protein